MNAHNSSHSALKPSTLGTWAASQQKCPMHVAQGLGRAMGHVSSRLRARVEHGECQGIYPRAGNDSSWKAKIGGCQTTTLGSDGYIRGLTFGFPLMLSLKTNNLKRMYIRSCVHYLLFRNVDTMQERIPLYSVGTLMTAGIQVKCSVTIVSRRTIKNTLEGLKNTPSCLLRVP